MDPFGRDLLNPSGIYSAIDTYDMGKVLEEAIKALTRNNCINSAISNDYNCKQIEGKCKLKSKEARILGNEYYKAGKMKKAILLYNQALALAPKSSKEMILAYSNRSAVFFHKRYITACVKDINVCLSLGCSGTVAEKLKKRLQDASQLTCLEYELNLISDDLARSFFRLPDHNSHVPCVRSDVTFETDGVKKITAAAEIEVGSIVGIEKAFVTCPGEKYIVCYYCNRPELCLYPCEGCEALFCGEECRERCLKEYHSIECCVAELFVLYPKHLKIAMRAAIKMSLMMTWDDFVAASTDIGALRMKAATVKQAFNCEEPLSVISYTENDPFMEGRMYSASTQYAVFLLNLLQFSKNYFPEEKDKRKSAVLALGRVMLQLTVNFTNIIEIDNSVYNIDSKSIEIQRGAVGLFSMSSKLKHSCEPNLYVLGLNDSIALVALKTIKRGEELTISYGGIFYDWPVFQDANLRMVHLFLKSRQMCVDCRACLRNWNRNNAVTVEMTKKQAKLFENFTKSSKNLTYQHFNDICNVLNSFPFYSTQYLTAYDDFRRCLIVMQSKLNYFYF